VSNETETLREQLKANRRRFGGYREFALSNGLGVSWLYKFVEGHYKKPGRTLLCAVRRGLAKLAD